MPLISASGQILFQDTQLDKTSDKCWGGNLLSICCLLETLQTRNAMLAPKHLTAVKVYEQKFWQLLLELKTAPDGEKTLLDFSVYLSEVGGEGFLSFLEGFDLAGG